MSILEQICADKRVEVAARKEIQTLGDLQARLPAIEKRPDFVKALRATPMGLIAEVKRRSPSAGLIRDPFDPAAIAQGYEANGASAVSCLMDHKYFGGGDDDFCAVRGAVGIPMLYKEFVVDSWQIAHAKTMGASAVLLIVGALTDKELVSFIAEIKALELQPLVEVHDREEMLRAIDAGTDCIGINNRNLKTFVTTLDTTFELAVMAPAGCTLVSESGIKTPEDVVELKLAGAHAILVGESLLREPAPGEAAAHLLSLI
ncbi:indole-3-glycerol phosphate synthase TrpC [Pontiella sulfatireligans]|uniref:Indole-3-glycerol phosphate synthase n=1 Tax=Pontiella sulfatireligans TaxID=2750658 RepID=A0A6C2UMU2_9BACT|nr:indole-3-glycerol phosphate synthase TrpC [Pontiella sulfatireligans]VGO21590.1 Indole-3-glycerol phosphate synthase [Pontiella sulfatireligans]